MRDRRILTPALLRQLLRYEPETGKLYWRPRGPEWFGTSGRQKAWHTRFAGRETLKTPWPGGYLGGVVLGCRLWAHRAAYSIHHGVPIDDLAVVDHLNGDVQDNRIVNLRNVVPSENSRNLKLFRNNKSGHPGVRWMRDRRRWEASIVADGKRHYLGSFRSFEDALACRKAGERRHGFHPNHGRARCD